MLVIDNHTFENLQSTTMLMHHDLDQLLQWAYENFSCFHYVNGNHLSGIGSDQFKLNSNGFEMNDNNNEDEDDDDNENNNDDDQDYDYDNHLEFTFLHLNRFLLFHEKHYLANLTNKNISNLTDFLKNLVSSCNNKPHLLSQNFVRIAISDNRLELETCDADLMLELTKSLGDTDFVNSNRLLRYQINSLELKLDEMIENEHQFEESERRTQSELYESADFTRQLVQQLSSAIELDEL